MYIVTSKSEKGFCLKLDQKVQSGNLLFKQVTLKQKINIAWQKNRHAARNNCLLN